MMLKYGPLLLLWLLLAPASTAAQGVGEAAPGEAVERHLPSDEPLTQWSVDPELLDTEHGDRLEQREVLAEVAKTVKLTDVVPPIRFESGVADIPPSYVERLRAVLEGMRHLRNVRLHLVGHADNQPLSPGLSRIYGDNAGLSRERAGEVAEFLQAALALPPEAIAFEWAGDTRPIATNATAEGRALNRRVEVEVWYDEMESELATEEVVVPEEIKRVKVCRTETVCKLRYVQGHERRARVKNLVAPLRFGPETAGVPETFIERIAQTLHNLRDKQNVTVRFVGFTDDAALAGREERIYGTHLALSRARAHRVALAVQGALELSSSAVESDGRGAAQPVASNQTARGRALNRRVEVEFWYDDPLQELPDEPQLCPDAAGAELVTKVFDPPWGRIPAVPIEAGQPVIPEGYADELRRALDEVGDKTNARLRFVGYTSNERLDRRTALVYGDDIGLSAARARRTMERIQAELGLSDAQVEHEGHGYVHSNDVVNAGFMPGETSHVAVEVVYDELALLDEYEGVEVTPINRELRPEHPLRLNLMRITVDGEPIDDPGKSSADIQRCTDVALQEADIQFQFDNLESEPRLSVTSDPGSVRLSASAPDAVPLVEFRMYTNYGHFIDRSEVRIFAADQSLQATPLDVVEVGEDGRAEWRPAAQEFAAPVRELKYVLRAYDAEGRFDETAPRPLWMYYETPAPGTPPEPRPEESDGDGEADAADGLPDGWGENSLALKNIPLGSGTVRVKGAGVPPQHTVWLAGEPVPVDEDGNFAGEVILPTGRHTVELAVLDEAGNGELFLRDLEFKRNDWFYVGLADVTLTQNSTSGPADMLTGQNAPYDPDSSADGRLAFYVNGQFGEDWKLVASADSREGPLEDMFSNFMDKSPQSLVRRIDPDYYYPTFGDDSTVEEMAPTSGKFFVKLDSQANRALWGNFKVAYLDNELAHVDRGLYGASLRFASPWTTSFGEKRFALDGFAAEPGTVPSREEFRATGGSSYFLRHQDLLSGSERVRIEVRDKDSGLVTRVQQLRPAADYDIDYIQGRILLFQPLSSVADDGMLVRNDGLGGGENWLVVQYEYTPGFDDVDALSSGGQGHVWFTDFLKLGLTASTNDEGDADSSLYAADMTLRKSAASWLKLQTGSRQGAVTDWLRSDDGGFGFVSTQDLGLTEADAGAYRADVSIGFADFFSSGRGSLTMYAQSLDAGYSAPGLTAFTDTRLFGGTFTMPLTDRLHVAAKMDRRIQTEGLETAAQEIDVGYQLGERWSLSAGVRNELREDGSPVVPATQEEGERTDALVQLTHDSKGRWSAYGFAQTTLSATENREDNGRIGVGGAYRISDRFMLDAEVSHGDLGPGAKLGTSFQPSNRTNLYLNYALENERSGNGLDSSAGNLIAGARTRLSDHTSVYLENRYQRADSQSGLTHSTGLTWSPTNRWNVATNWDVGTLVDRQTGAETLRKAGGANIGYGFQKARMSAGVEYRFDETEQPDGTWSERRTLLFRNTLKYQVTPDWRLVGKLNLSDSESSLGEFFDGGFTEGVLGYAYRPVAHDRFNALVKYTYFYDVPSTDPFNLQDAAAQFLQRSHIASLDVTYDLTPNLSVGGKYAYRMGQVSLDREDPDFFDNNAHLYILRADWRFLRDWEGLVEMRMLDLPELDERRSGALLMLYRYLGNNLKVGIGYNFTDFSEDLKDQSYDHRGFFINLITLM